MKRGIVILFALFVLATFVSSSAEAKSVETVRFIPCTAADGTYKLTIQIGGPGVGPAATVSMPNGVFGYRARIRQNGGLWTYYEYGIEGLVLKYGGLPEGTKFEVELLNIYDLRGFDEPVIAIPNIYSITLQGNDYPSCFKKCDGTPLFKMYLLTKPDSYCILISDVHPSVESQKALCFPGTEWVASNTACEGWVCDNGCWDCDYLGYGRITFKDLMHIYKQRMGMSE